MLEFECRASHILDKHRSIVSAHKRGLYPQHGIKRLTVAHTCDPSSAQEPEAGRSTVQGRSWPHSRRLHILRLSRQCGEVRSWGSGGEKNLSERIEQWVQAPSLSLLSVGCSSESAHVLLQMWDWHWLRKDELDGQWPGGFPVIGRLIWEAGSETSEELR